MSDWISFLPHIILAQALGVGVAWGADALSWKWRRNEDAVFGFNFLNLFFVIPYVLWAFGIGWFIRLFGPVLLWLLIASEVQRRQIKIQFSAAFFGAMMQLSCFGWMLSGALILLFLFNIFFRGLLFIWSMVVCVISAILINALLSLFRPTIYGVWNTWRQNGKN